jgi:hypothetical protein
MEPKVRTADRIELLQGTLEMLILRTLLYVMFQRLAEGISRHSLWNFLRGRAFGREDRMD